MQIVVFYCSKDHSFLSARIFSYLGWSWIPISYRSGLRSALFILLRLAGSRDSGPVLSKFSGCCGSGEFRVYRPFSSSSEYGHTLQCWIIYYFSYPMSVFFCIAVTTQYLLLAVSIPLAVRLSDGRLLSPVELTLTAKLAQTFTVTGWNLVNMFMYIFYLYTSCATTLTFISPSYAMIFVARSVNISALSSAVG